MAASDSLKMHWKTPRQRAVPVKLLVYFNEGVVSEFGNIFRSYFVKQQQTAGTHILKAIFSNNPLLCNVEKRSNIL